MTDQRDKTTAERLLAIAVSIQRDGFPSLAQQSRALGKGRNYLANLSAAGARGTIAEVGCAVARRACAVYGVSPHHMLLGRANTARTVTMWENFMRASCEA